MLQVSPRGLIAVNRGDTFTLELSLNVGTPLNILNFDMREGDVAYLRLFRSNEPWEEYMLSKEATVEDVEIINDEKFIHFKFIHEDTNYLTADCYFYELKMFFSRNDNDYVETIIPRNKFIITN